MHNVSPLRTTQHDVVAPSPRRPTAWALLTAALELFREPFNFGGLQRHLIRSDEGAGLWFGMVLMLSGWFARLAELPAAHATGVALNDPWVSAIVEAPAPPNAVLVQLEVLRMMVRDVAVLELEPAFNVDGAVLGRELRQVLDAGARWGTLEPVRVWLAVAPSRTGAGDRRLVMFDAGTWRGFVAVFASAHAAAVAS